MDDSRAKLKAWFQGQSLFWPIAGLGVLLLFNLIFSSGFFRLEIRNGALYGTLVDIFNQSSKVMLLSIGMTLVIAAGGVDLSVGSVMAIAGAVAALLTTKIAFVWVLLAALGSAVVAGGCNGILVGLFGIQPIIATLILMVAGRGVAMLLTNGQIITFTDKSLDFIANGHLFGLPFTLTIVIIVLAISLFITRKTAAGLFLESVGDNERAARFCGINVSCVKVLVYACSGLCAGMAGIIATSNIDAADSSRVGEMMELDAIFAVVVGGTSLTGGRFTLVGSVIGALLIQTLTISMQILGVPPAVTPVPKAVVIVAVCLMQSEKFRNSLRVLLGRRAAA